MKDVMVELDLHLPLRVHAPYYYMSIGQNLWKR